MARKLTAYAAIREYCLNTCCAGDMEFWVDCPSTEKSPTPCPLYPFRFGNNPNISEETRQIKAKQAAGRYRQNGGKFQQSQATKYQRTSK